MLIAFLKPSQPPSPSQTAHVTNMANTTLPIHHCHSKPIGVGQSSHSRFWLKLHPHQLQWADAGDMMDHLYLDITKPDNTYRKTVDPLNLRLSRRKLLSLHPRTKSVILIRTLRSTSINRRSNGTGIPNTSSSNGGTNA